MCVCLFVMCMCLLLLLSIRLCSPFSWASLPQFPPDISQYNRSHSAHFPFIHPSIDLWAQCPLVSNVSSLPHPHYRWVSRLDWDWLWYPGLSSVLVSIAFPYAFHISVFFHSLFFTCHWISFVFLLYGWRICTHSVDPSLTHFLGEFPGMGLALVPMLCIYIIYPHIYIIYISLFSNLNNSHTSSLTTPPCTSIECHGVAVTWTEPPSFPCV